MYNMTCIYLITESINNELFYKNNHQRLHKTKYFTIILMGILKNSPHNQSWETDWLKTQWAA